MSKGLSHLVILFVAYKEESRDGSAKPSNLEIAAELLSGIVYMLCSGSVISGSADS
jgi:hypothetical protein